MSLLGLAGDLALVMLVLGLVALIGVALWELWKDV